MIERGIIFLVCAILAIFLLASCATPMYVCQQALHESGAPVLLCSPIKPEQVSDKPVQMKPQREKPDERA